MIDWPGMLTLTLLCFQYIMGHVWFADEGTASDAECYRVVYEDGEREEYDKRDIKNNGLTFEQTKSRSAPGPLARQRSVRGGYRQTRVAQTLFVKHNDGNCGWLEVSHGMHRRTEDHETEDGGPRK
jgi:hypothetical protein